MKGKSKTTLQLLERSPWESASVELGLAIAPRVEAHLPLRRHSRKMSRIPGAFYSNDSDEAFSPSTQDRLEDDTMDEDDSDDAEPTEPEDPEDFPLMDDNDEEEEDDPAAGPGGTLRIAFDGKLRSASSL